jgi:hypothetical protein
VQTGVGEVLSVGSAQEVTVESSQEVTQSSTQQVTSGSAQEYYQGSAQAITQSSVEQVTLGSAQEYYQGSTQQASQSSTQQVTQYESEVDQLSSQHTSLGGQLADAALTLVGQYASGKESKSVGGLIGDVVATLAEGAIASHGGAVRSEQENITSSSCTREVVETAVQENVSSSVEVAQTTTEAVQEGFSSSTEIVQSAHETAQESVSSSVEVVQSATAQESISSSTDVVQTAAQERSTVVGSSTATVAILETDQCAGAQSPTGIMVSSAPNVSTSRVQGSLQGEHVEATYDSVVATSSDIQAGALTTSTSTTTLVAGEDHGVSFTSAAVGERVDTSAVNEFEGGIQTINQTSLSAEITRAEATSSTSATAQEREFRLA